MPRPKPLVPKARIHLVLPQDLYARLRLMFYTEANERMLMHGAMSEFITTAIKEKLERNKRDLHNQPIHTPEPSNSGGAKQKSGQGSSPAS